MGRLLIVSNRLPVSPELDENDNLVFAGSAGGLATGLGSFYKRYESLWVGWCESAGCDGFELRERLLQEHSCVPVFLDPTDAHLYYEGFSNETVWPTFHHFAQYAQFDEETWQAYKRVNHRFADAVMEQLQPDDIVWINDYHLMLLPSILRDRMPEITVGFFLHIPFPSFEIFRMLPWREQILNGLLGADVIGFHTYDYVRHFLSSALRLAGRDHTLGQIAIGSRTVKVDAFPMGIDYERFASAASSPEVAQMTPSLRAHIGDRRFILSVDRLDYSKGIPVRLEAFERFLAEHPEWHRKVGLTMVAVPSRTDVEHYQLLKREVDELVGRVNGRYGTMDWTPVRYLYRSLPFNELVAMYKEADVMLVTPLRDGMNLVAKEYVATKDHSGTGVLVLSELAGSAAELGEALVVNPFDQTDIVDAIGKALDMPVAEQQERLTAMQERLRRYTVVDWAEDFMGAVELASENRRERAALNLSAQVEQRLLEDYGNAARRLLLLDYDGTLVGFSAKPGSTKPDDQLRTTLHALAADERNEVVIISGRDRKILAEWLGDLDVSLVAEHGAMQRRRGGEWIEMPMPPDTWIEAVRSVMERYVDRTPRTFIEQKEHALVWHYRAADPGLGPQRARELHEALAGLTENHGLAIMEGHRVLEVKPANVNKGRAAIEFVESEVWEFVLAVGDDRTDEDVFEVLPASAYSIKVGGGGSLARYRAEGVTEVRSLLGRMAR
ncbi:MAG: bifunctional alpha,alpha-trehalose-phosphate synthase (UDP-forming)/trehalose-phosphatase [Coriobacteriia bacterium]|nr:bifunctional alpha,alpha-trehalose-phosphate synthase (UDP-forming)/trehalose-phosphatase [Coriobacteriia bacterium]